MDSIVAGVVLHQLAQREEEVESTDGWENGRSYTGVLGDCARQRDVECHVEDGKRWTAGLLSCQTGARRDNLSGHPMGCAVYWAEQTAEPDNKVCR